jgi:hypothetical protein
MSDLLDCTLPLIPNPQQVQLGPRRWKPRRNWCFSEGDRDRWIFGEGKGAETLLTGLTPPENDFPEAYALVAGPEGGTPAARRKMLAETRRLRSEMRKTYRGFLEPTETDLQEASLFAGEETLLAPKG